MTEPNDERARGSHRGGSRGAYPPLEMLRWDVRLQVRYGIYPVYAVLTLLFVVGLRLVEPGVRTDATVLLIAVDPSALGFYFVAVLVLYEKGECVLDALVVSPLGGTGYLLSKTLSLSLLATGTSVVVAVASHGVSLRTPILVVGVLLSSSLFVLIGFVAVARFHSINGYFLSAAIWGAVLFSPILGYLGLFDTALFYLLPVRPLLVTVEAGLRPVEPWTVAYAVGYLLLANVVALRWARRSFERNVVRGGDPGRRLGHVPGTVRDSGPIAARSPWLGLLLTDLRNWVRDPMLAFAATGPVLLALLVRLAAPMVTTATADVLDLGVYYPVIAGTMTVFGPGIFGFVVGMFFLEDRDRGILSVYRTSPISLRGYLLYRGSTAFLFAFASVLPAIVVVDLVRAPLSVVLLSAVLGGLGGPVVALALGLVASNTIQGVALSKFLNLFLLGPALLVAVVPEPWQFVAGAVPAYWPVKTYVAGATGDPSWPLYWTAGALVHVLALVVLGRWVIPRRVRG